jgi:uncharacterized protein
MMNLIAQIKEKQINARKSGSKEASLLTTLLGEASAVGKNAGNRETTDAEVVAVVKKFIKNIDETISALSSRNQDSSAFVAEKKVLEEFLPKQLSEDELKKIAAGRSSMPDFMKYLKEQFNGQYDGKLASSVAKTVFG